MKNIKELIDEKKKNSEKIEELSTTINVWMSTPKSPQITQQISDIREYVVHRMLQYEIEGQKEKIKHMNEVISLLKKST